MYGYLGRKIRYYYCLFSFLATQRERKKRRKDFKRGSQQKGVMLRRSVDERPPKLNSAERNEGASWPLK